MLEVLVWLLAVETIGIVCFPLVYVLFPFLVDRGFALSKTLGILLVTYGLWLLGSLHVLPATGWSAALLLGVLGIGTATLAIFHRHEILIFLRRERTTILFTELVFLSIFLGWVLYRAYDPSIASTEKPMDFAFLNANLLANYFPPEDPWLLGHPVSYYYFGYLMMGTLAEVTGIESSVAYNLALALLPALAGVACFSLVATLVRPLRSFQFRNNMRAWFWGVIGTVLFLLVGNLAGGIEFMRLRGIGSSEVWEWLQIKGLEASSETASLYPLDHWWWWRSSRIVDTLHDGQSLDYTINEFPFFSLLLGDLHPHLMALPFVLLVIALCVNLLRNPAALSNLYGWKKLPYLFVWALALGALGFLNLWDLATLTGVVSGTVFLRFLMEYPNDSLLRITFRVIRPLGLLIPLSLALYAPFYANFTSQASGVFPVVGPVTRYIHFFIIWALFLVPVFVLVISHLIVQLSSNRRYAVDACVSIAIVLMPFMVWALAAFMLGEAANMTIQRFVHLVPYHAMLWAILYGLISGARNSASASLLFALGLAFSGLFLLMVTDLFYLVDMFNNRMNTVFKLYYQAWVFLALSATFGLYYWSVRVGASKGIWRMAHYVGVALFLLMLTTSLYYPIVASYSKANGFQSVPTLDGLAYLTPESVGEYNAIQWLQEKARPGSRIVEAIGEDYSAHGRISSSTGFPTLLGWAGHEIQWRGSSKPLAGRREAVDLIYQATNPNDVRHLIDRYGIDYVIVGPREIAQYGEMMVQKFDLLMQKSFDQNGVVIYDAQLKAVE